MLIRRKGITIKPQKILIGVILAIYMQFGYYALCEAETLAKNYGEKLTKQIAAKYKGEWKLVIGASGDSPIVLLGNGETRKLSSSAKLGYQDLMLPIAGTIKVLDKVFVPTGDLRPSMLLEFVCDQDFDDLYLVVFFRFPQTQNISGILVREIGVVKSGKIQKAKFMWNYSEGVKNPLIGFYHKGLGLKADFSKVKKSK